MDKRLEKIQKEDMRYVMQTYKRLPVAFVRGEGTRLWDTDGREYLDLVSGLGVTILGHCHPAITEAICRQAGLLLHTTNLYYVEPQVRLARLLAENSFAGKCFFSNSGAEANEGALKLARKYHVLNGKPRSKVVCIVDSFHGRTLATLFATGQPKKWKPFSPPFPGFSHVPLNDVEALLKAVDEDTEAVLIEPIQGEAGVRLVSEDFMRAARSACDSTGALLILDEVQTGLARTGRMFAYEHYGVLPDVMTLAKGLANGVPVGAFLASEELGTVLRPGDHGSTFGGGFLACAAACETLTVLLEQNICENARNVGGVVLERLRSMVGRIPGVVEARGRGLMLAIELSGGFARDVVLECLERGVIVNDVTPSAIRLLPALVISEEDALRGQQVLEDVLIDFGNKGGGTSG